VSEDNVRGIEMQNDDLISRCATMIGGTRLEVVRQALRKEYGEELGTSVDPQCFLDRANKGDMPGFVSDYCNEFIGESKHPSLF